MAGVTYFVQECPTCGRRLQIRIDYMGKKVACRHCQARFQATDASTSDSWTLLNRADELIAGASGIYGSTHLPTTEA